MRGGKKWFRRPTPIELGNGVVIESMSPAELRGDYLRRRVAETIVRPHGGLIRVSTVELHHGDLFETFVFGGVLDCFSDRSATRTAAKITHKVIAFTVRHGAETRAAERARLRRMHAAYRARRA
jgi:hypothetical protein